MQISSFRSQGQLRQVSSGQNQVIRNASQTAVRFGEDDGIHEIMKLIIAGIWASAIIYVGVGLSRGCSSQQTPPAKQVQPSDAEKIEQLQKELEEAKAKKPQ